MSKGPTTAVKAVSVMAFLLPVYMEGQGLVLARIKSPVF